MKHLRTRNTTYFVVSVSCVTVATLFYDSFLLLALTARPRPTGGP